ncbi:MAG: phosphate ABC transporter substrate-binding protein PstS [Candidatus Eremiobacteraeota bacterium]|nr:phosphate ABC transporter substrate-binding protein PstS [Candidatus Eremiobacteraeota bacterium]
MNRTLFPFKGRACAIALLGAALLIIGGCSGNSPSKTASGGRGGGNAVITGAGSSFDYPLFTRAFYQYSQEHPGVSVNYQSIGSGGGIEQFTKKTVDFGATDVPMNANELSAVDPQAAARQLPIALGGVAVSYNVPGAPQHLSLSPAVLAAVFAGKVNNWSDPAIAKLNRGFKAASLPIVVVHRADGSGTTYIFTDYLSTVSRQWKTATGKGKTVSWSASSAMGAKGNEGVAGTIRNTPGAIGYVELSYALQNKMPYAAISNRFGVPVLPSLSSIGSAAAAKPGVSPSDFSIVDQPGRDSYPIAGYSWLLIYGHYPDTAKQKAIRDLFTWMLGPGQKSAPELNYVPLPRKVADQAKRKLASSAR